MRGPRASESAATTALRQLPARSTRWATREATQLQDSKDDSSDSDSAVSEFIPDESEIDAVAESEPELEPDESDVDLHTGTGVISRSELTEDEISDDGIAEDGGSIQLELVEMEEQVCSTDLEILRGTSIIPDDDIDDTDDLFDGNVRPVEYYRNELRNMNTNDFRRKEYAKGTEKLIANTETQWHLFV